MKRFPFEQLVCWYKKEGRYDLPWRDYKFDQKTLAYRVWLSEILLQQTQATRGAEYFQRIIKKYPKVEDLASVDYEIFFEDYKGLGYYSRARNLLKTAKIIVEDFDGYFPTTTRELVQFPGIGPYTAEAIRAFAFEIPTLSFDTNLEKIFSRYYHGNRFISLTKEEKQKILMDFIESGVSSRDFNNACMDFGALVSQNNAATVDFGNYPLVGDTFAEEQGKNEPNIRKKVAKFPADKAKIIVILHKDHKEYFSETEGEYSPFILAQSVTTDKRAYIKKFFRDRYNLEVSVRPAHKKVENKHQVYMVFNAQIQTGDNHFFIYKKADISAFEL